MTLATEWPDTWRTLAREPRLAEAAYAADPAEREKMRLALRDKQSSNEAKQAIDSTLQRLMHDPLLVRLLGANPGGKAGAVRASEAPDFAATRIEAAAIRQFNRIMWEPGFPMDFSTPPPLARA